MARQAQSNSPSVEDALADRAEEVTEQAATQGAITVGTGAAAGAVAGGAAGAGATGAAGLGAGAGITAGGAAGGAAGAGASAAAAAGTTGTASGAATGAAAGASTGSSAALAAAWPLAILAGLYISYTGYTDARKAVGGGLTDEEAFAATDPIGYTVHDYLPEEYTDITPHSKVWGAAFGSKKSDEELFRDRWRRAGAKGGLFVVGDNDQHYVTLANGDVYNISLDGAGSQIQAFDSRYVDPTTINDPNHSGNAVGNTRPYNVDQSNPLSFQTGWMINGLGALTTGASEELNGKAIGYLTNAALSNASSLEEARANARKFYEDAFAGVSAETGISAQELALGSLQVLYDTGQITEEQFIAYSDGVNQTFAEGPVQKMDAPDYLVQTEQGVGVADIETGEIIPGATTTGNEYMDQFITTGVAPAPEQDINEDSTRLQRGIAQADPSKGGINNTGTAGIVLDNPDNIDTLGNPSKDVMPPIGDPTNPIPKPSESLGPAPTDTSVGVARPELQEQIKATATGGTPSEFTGNSNLQQVNPVPQQTQQAILSPDSNIVLRNARGGTGSNNVSNPNDVGVAPPANSPVPRNAPQQQGLTFDEQNALLDKQFQQQQALQNSAISAQEDSQRKSILSALTLSEVNKLQGNTGSQNQIKPRNRVAQNSQSLVNTILGGT